MRKKKEPEIDVQVTFTEGYEDRFTREILKIYEKRQREKAKQETESQTA